MFTFVCSNLTNMPFTKPDELIAGKIPHSSQPLDNVWAVTHRVSHSVIKSTTASEWGGVVDVFCIGKLPGR